MKNLLFLFILCLSANVLFTNCSKGDPCEGILCLNGGECINGDCLCPDGFEGPDCSILKVPQQTTLLSIKVTEYPEKAPNGSRWDSTTEHDPQILIYNQSDQLLWSSDIKVNIPYSKPLEFSCNWVFPSSTDSYKIFLVDDDPLGFETIGGFNFSAEQPLFGGYTSPQILIGTDIRFELNLEFDF